VFQYHVSHIVVMFLFIKCDFIFYRQSGVTPPITSFPSGSFPSDDLFFNLGAPRLSSQSSLPSVGGNPFG
jgi:hypothetical protein